MEHLKDWAQGGIIGLLGIIITVLFTKRASNKVETDNARANRESRFEENLQARYEHAMAQNSQLRAEIDELKQKVAEADKRMTVLQMISAGDPQRAVEFAQESGFLDMSRPLRQRPAPPPPPSPHDPFQAADPYAPPPRKKK